MDIHQINEKEVDHKINIYDPEIEGPQNGPSDYLKDLFRERDPKQSWSNQVGFIGGPSSKRKGRKLIGFSWAAAMIDSVVVIAISALFISIFSLGLKSLDPELFLSLKKIPSEQFLLSVVLMVLWVYQVTLRSFIGSTVGEWTYDIRMGSPYDRLLLSYNFKLILRATLVIASGVILFPIFSMLFGQDLLGRVCGLKMFSL